MYSVDHLVDMTNDRKFSRTRIAKAQTLMDALEASRSLWMKALLGPRTLGKNTGCRVEGEQSATKAPATVHSKAKLTQLFQAQRTRVDTRRVTREITNEAFAHSVPSGTRDVTERKRILKQLGGEPLTAFYEGKFAHALKVSVLARCAEFPKHTGKSLVRETTEKTTLRCGFQTINNEMSMPN